MSRSEACECDTCPKWEEGFTRSTIIQVSLWYLYRMICTCSHFMNFFSLYIEQVVPGTSRCDPSQFEVS